MGNRLDNLTEYERDIIDRCVRHQSYYINRVESVDYVRYTLRFFPNTVENCERIQMSILDEKIGKNRVSIINLLESELKKIQKNESDTDKTK